MQRSRSYSDMTGIPYPLSTRDILEHIEINGHVCPLTEFQAAIFAIDDVWVNMAIDKRNSEGKANGQ